MSFIYSIGHGNKPIDIFLDELGSFNIEFLIDVRSIPYSKWHPQFKKDQLEKELEKHNIKYVFMGDSLGGLPKEPDCYDANGKVIYEKMKEKSFFKKGLQRLLTANRKEIPIAIMCSETDPRKCHRSRLIGAELLAREKISLLHIVGAGKRKSQEIVMSELTRGGESINLFDK